MVRGTPEPNFQLPIDRSWYGFCTIPEGRSQQQSHSIEIAFSQLPQTMPLEHMRKWSPLLPTLLPTAMKHRRNRQLRKEAHPKEGESANAAPSGSIIWTPHTAISTQIPEMANASNNHQLRVLAISLIAVRAAIDWAIGLRDTFFTNTTSSSPAADKSTSVTLLPRHLTRHTPGFEKCVCEQGSLFWRQICCWDSAAFQSDWNAFRMIDWSFVYFTTTWRSIVVRRWNRRRSVLRWPNLVHHSEIISYFFGNCVPLRSFRRKKSRDDTSFSLKRSADLLRFNLHWSFVISELLLVSGSHLQKRWRRRNQTKRLRLQRIYIWKRRVRGCGSWRTPAGCCRRKKLYQRSRCYRN